MTLNTEEMKRQKRTMSIVVIYQIVVILLSVALNIFVFEVHPFVVTLPSNELFQTLIIATVLLVLNHTWLMTATELTRVRFKMYSTPEEWLASGTNREDATKKGISELERHHSTHQNTKENVVYYVLLALIFVFSSPPTIVATVWLVGFAVARLGYTYSYLYGKDNARGLFMSLSLLAMYGLASYLVMSLII
jgi:uncharacterized MAPEG superfamily protein